MATAGLEFNGRLVGPAEIISAASQTELIISQSDWIDIGGEQKVSGANSLALWLHIIKNDSKNGQVRLITKHQLLAVDEYVVPIKSINPISIQITNEIINLEDADQKIVLTWTLNGVVPLVKFQIRVGTVGAVPGKILSAYITTAI